MRITIGKPSLPPVTVTEIKGDLMMVYGGTKGESQRLISLNSLKGFQLSDGTIEITTICAYCHERKMARSFKMDSVKQLTVPETGEVVTDILAWLRQKEGES